MGINVFPVPSSTAVRNWVQLATSTPSSGTTASFTSLAAYPNYRVIIAGSSGMTTTAGTQVRLNLNGSATNSSLTNHFGVNGASTFTMQGTWGSSIALTNGAWNVNNNFTANAIIEDANSLPVVTSQIYAPDSGNAAYSATGTFFTLGQINRIDVVLTGANFTGTGTITIYGSNV